MILQLQTAASLTLVDVRVDASGQKMGPGRNRPRKRVTVILVTLLPPSRRHLPLANTSLQPTVLKCIMVNAICPICKECYSLEKLLFLPCGKPSILSLARLHFIHHKTSLAGHGFCTTCTIRDNANHQTCAICRQSKGHEPPRPIYVTLESGSTTQHDSQVARVLDTLDRVDASSGSASVLDITRTIRRVVNETPIEKEVAVSVTFLLLYRY